GAHRPMTAPSTDPLVPVVETTDAADEQPDLPAPASRTTPTPGHAASSAEASAFWDAIDAELAATPANSESFEIPLYSTAFSTTYRYRFTSLGSYRIAAYISVPHGEGPFPALLSVPGYGSVVTPPQYEDRQRYVVMTLMYRGTRGADWPYAGAFPGMFTDGIADPAAWIYRGILADHLRGLEMLASHPQVDAARIGLHGNDIALLIAARRPEVSAVAVTGSFFHRLWEVARSTEAYPFEEINDYLRTYPHDTDAVQQTLALVDPGAQAARIGATTLVSVNDDGATGDAAWWASLTEAIAGAVDLYLATHEGQTDRDAIDAWLADHLGTDPKPRIWTPEDLGPWS
ncbi:MAG: acetylxylan esterase, partial [Thermomicrobiales bacterium]